jgi:hypothetical protein
MKSIIKPTDIHTTGVMQTVLADQCLASISNVKEFNNIAFSKSHVFVEPINGNPYIYAAPNTAIGDKLGTIESVDIKKSSGTDKLRARVFLAMKFESYSKKHTEKLLRSA